jgi:spermidine synthase
VALSLATPAAAADLLEQVESYYNSIFVYQSRSYVTLAFGHEGRTYVESQRNTEDLLELPVEYTRSFTAALAYAQNLERLLMIGMGGGSTSWYMHSHMPDASITAVELDPDIVRLAEKYYDLVEQPNFDIVEADGRLFLMRDENLYDIIFVDAYRGPFVPFHLLTQEFYEIAKQRLQPGGFLAQNVEPSTMLFDSSHATLLSAFDTVDFFRASGNVIAVAYDGPRRPIEDLMQQAITRQTEYGFRYDLPELVAQRRTRETPADDIEVLTDDFAPVNILRAIEVHNRKWD